MVNILKTIKERRSVRQYQDKAIPVEIVEELKQALIWAPSAANLQARKFYFVSNQEIKNKLAENASAKNKMIMSQAPLIIVACTDELKIEKFGERGKNVYLITDIASSLQNATLVAYEYGLGSCWLGNFEEVAVRKILNLPVNLRPLLILSVGYPAETPEAKARVSVDEAVVEVK
ncbi:MAG: nitroreductase family protein [bacterium]|nr:nitroreductase family protein [bacterium]